MLSITDSLLDETISSESLTVVDCFAPSCRPCHMMVPVLNEVAKQFPDVQFYTLNVDENQTSATKYGISAVPTLLIFKNGKEIKRTVGIQDGKKLVETLQKLKG